MICARLRPRVRRVSSRALALNRATVCGAKRRLMDAPIVKLKPRNFRIRGAATALFALLTLSLRRLARNRSMPVITRSPARAVVGVAHEATAALLQFLVQYVQHRRR